MLAIGQGAATLQTANLFAAGGTGALKAGGCNCGGASCPTCGVGGTAGLSSPSGSGRIGGGSDAAQPLVAPIENRTDGRSVLANADGGTIAQLIGAQEVGGSDSSGDATSQDPQNTEEEVPEEGFDPANPDGLSAEEEEVVQDLQQRDQEVRRHEQAHAAAGGQYAGSPTYEYTTGPDGRRYATGGQVSIDTSPIDGDPQATIDKMDQVIRAALAPAEPSGQDRAVASAAQSAKAQAQAELTAERAAELSGETEDGEPVEEPEGSDASDSDSNIDSPSNATDGPFAAQGSETTNGIDQPQVATGTAGEGDGQSDNSLFGGPLFGLSQDSGRPGFSQNREDRQAGLFQQASALFEAAGGLTRGDRPGSGLNLIT